MKNAIDLEPFTEEDLIKLNEQIIERLIALKNQSKQEQIFQFKVGDIVSFLNAGQKEEGVIIRVNQKTVSVMTVGHAKLVLFPELLIKEKRASEKIRAIHSKLFSKR
jgi:hypothetical protein